MKWKIIYGYISKESAYNKEVSVYNDKVISISIYSIEGVSYLDKVSALNKYK